MMKYPVILFLLMIHCGLTQRVITQPASIPASPNDHTVHKAIIDPVISIFIQQDTEHIPKGGTVSVLDFGAKWDGRSDDIIPDSTACAYCIAHPWLCSTVTFPAGSTHHSRPLLLQRVTHGANQYFTINLVGAVSNKPYLDGYGSTIFCDYKQGFGIGIEYGRGILIKNLSIVGQYAFPNTVTNKNIATFNFSDWADGSVVDTWNNPYAGISVDPLPLLQGGAGGTSGVEISQCAIKQWMVGVVLSPNATTLNAEMINFMDDNIDAVRVCIAVCQDQSKTIKIDGLKVWSSVHTILDGVHYGLGIGGGSTFNSNWNIAGNCNELFNLRTDRFPLSCMNLYSESLFRIGNVGYGTGANFINCEFDFLTGAGMPAADYILNGQANFYGGSIRYYDNSPTHRLNLSAITGTFRDMTLNQQPFTIGLYGLGEVTYPQPSFDNVHNYYAGGLISNKPDTLISISPKSITIDRTKWTAILTGVPNALIGDYILGAPTSTNRTYYDRAFNTNSCNTLQIGRVIKISNGTLTLDDVGLNVFQNSGYDNIYIDRIKK